MNAGITGEILHIDGGQPPYTAKTVYSAFPLSGSGCILCHDEPLPGIPAIKVIHEGTFGTAGAGDWESMLAGRYIRR